MTDVFLILFFFAAACLYMLPAAIAYQRNRHNKEAISALNLLLGWTLLGWIAALAWSLTRTPNESHHEEPKDEFRKCPQCAEMVRREAIKCRHCGSELTQI